VEQGDCGDFDPVAGRGPYERNQAPAAPVRRPRVQCCGVRMNARWRRRLVDPPDRFSGPDLLFGT